MIKLSETARFSCKASSCGPSGWNPGLDPRQREPAPTRFLQERAAKALRQELERKGQDQNNPADVVKHHVERRSFRDRRMDAESGANTDTDHCEGRDEQAGCGIPPQPDTPTLQAAEQLTDATPTASDARYDNRGDHRRRRADGLQHYDEWWAQQRLTVEASVLQHRERHPEHPSDDEHEQQIGG